MMRAPDPAAVARFRADLESITGRPPSGTRWLGLAVSGGPDSVAMLLLAAAAYPGAIRAATVNHGLRAEAADEATLVARACAALGVDHAILVNRRHLAEGNLQEAARRVRYALLREWAERAGGPDPAGWVAVAHHRDDVAETFLMRARRGSGVAGLAAMRRSRPLEFDGGPQLIRPLLDWSRSELAGIVDSAGCGCASDPSNQAERFDRSRIRALLAAAPELPASRLALAARNLRHADDAIEAWVLRELTQRFEEDEQGDLWLDPGDLPYELRRRFLHRAIIGVRRENGLFAGWRASGLDRLLAALDAGGTGTIAGVQARAIGARWHFRLAPPRRSH